MSAEDGIWTEDLGAAMLTGAIWVLSRRSEVLPALAGQFRDGQVLQARLVHAVAGQLFQRPELVQSHVHHAGDKRKVPGLDVVLRIVYWYDTAGELSGFWDYFHYKTGFDNESYPLEVYDDDTNLAVWVHRDLEAVDVFPAMQSLMYFSSAYPVRPHEPEDGHDEEMISPEVLLEGHPSKRRQLGPRPDGIISAQWGVLQLFRFAAQNCPTDRPDEPWEIRERERMELKSHVDRCVRRFARAQMGWARLRREAHECLGRCIERLLFWSRSEERPLTYDEAAEECHDHLFIRAR